MRIACVLFVSCLLYLRGPSAVAFSLTPLEIPDFPQNRTWFNTQPLTKGDLKGKVVLYDFWTYSCINCIRTFPYLKSWYAKYHKMGFEIIGIHAPEFAFERDHNNVEKAIKQYGITWPVVLDNDNHLWNLFHNRFWPAEYLYGSDGKFIMSHFGEGAYPEMEAAIQKALGVKPIRSKPVAESVDFLSIGTPEIYLGSERGKRSDHYLLKGEWKILDEKVVSHGAGDRIILKYSARKVNIVAGSPTRPVGYTVRIDGKPLPTKWKTVDSGKPIREERLYRMIDTGKYGEHTIEIIFDAPGVEVYTFTFG